MKSTTNNLSEIVTLNELVTRTQNELGDHVLNVNPIGESAVKLNLNLQTEIGQLNSVFYSFGRKFASIALGVTPEGKPLMFETEIEHLGDKLEVTIKAVGVPEVDGERKMEFTLEESTSKEELREMIFNLLFGSSI